MASMGDRAGITHSNPFEQLRPAGWQQILIQAKALVDRKRHHVGRGRAPPPGCQRVHPRGVRGLEQQVAPAVRHPAVVDEEVHVAPWRGRNIHKARAAVSLSTQFVNTPIYSGWQHECMNPPTAVVGFR